jgi:hypothetical protein
VDSAAMPDDTRQNTQSALAPEILNERGLAMLNTQPPFLFEMTHRLAQGGPRDTKLRRKITLRGKTHANGIGAVKNATDQAVFSCFHRAQRKRQSHSYPSVVRGLTS